LIFLSGATGFIGGHIARLLVERGDRVRVLVRPTSDLRGIAGLELERATGDLRDPESLRQAIMGCRTVFHTAADYRFWVNDPAELYRSNVDGTRNILQAAKDAGVERVVYTSTVGCIGLPGGEEGGDENSPVSLDDMHGAYKRSKFMAEQAALEFAATGLPVVIVNPTAPVGDGDLKPTPTGKIIVDFLRGAMPAYLDTGLNLVDVRDVAAGHLLAAERGKPGERYILGGRNMTLHEIFQALEKLSGRPAPRVQIPYWLAWIAGAMEESVARFSRYQPRAPLDAVRMARKKMLVQSGTAQRELGFKAGPVEDALERAIEWVRATQSC
jgi:dihydroflavonol-4-reductase